MTRRHLYATTLLACGIASTLGLTPVGASAAEDPTPPRVVTVDVRTASGSPDAGAPVSLYAWPSGEELGQDERFELVKVGESTAAGSGLAKIAFDPDVDIEPLFGPSGTLDLEVVSNEGKPDVSSYSFTLSSDAASPSARGAVSDRRVLGGAPLDSSAPARVELRPLASAPEGSSRARMTETTDSRVASDADARPETATSDAQVLDRAEPDAAAPASARLASAAVLKNGCLVNSGTRRVKDLGMRWVNIGNVLIQGPGKRMKFTYTSSAESHLGVGVSVSGKYGTFSSEGSRTVSQSSTVGFPAYRGTTARLLDTQFRYGKYCTTTRSPGLSHRFHVRAERHEGGTRHRTTVRPSAPNKNCADYEVMQSWSAKANSKAITWTNGAKLGGKIGVDLSSRTGFTRQAKQEWIFRAPGRLCGTHDSPGGAPRMLVMRPPA